MFVAKRTTLHLLKSILFRYLYRSRYSQNCGWQVTRVNNAKTSLDEKEENAASRCRVFDFSANENSDSRSSAPSRGERRASSRPLAIAGRRQSLVTSGSSSAGRAGLSEYKRIKAYLTRRRERSRRRNKCYSFNKSSNFRSARTAECLLEKKKAFARQRARE